MNDNSEISINFKDYILYSLHRWKLMIVMALVFGCAVGAAYFLYKISKWDDEVKKYDAAVASYEEEMKSYNDSVAAMQSELDYEKSRMDYALNYIYCSVYYGLNADNTSVTVADIYLEFSEDTSQYKMDSILSLYADGIKYGTDWKDIGTICNLEAKYAEELVEVEVDYNAHIIRLRVIYPDEAVAKNMVQRIFDLAEKENSELKNLASYNASLYNLITYEDTLPELDVNRNNANSRYADFQNKVASAQSSLDGLKEPEMPVLKTRRMYLPVTILFGVVGVIIGILFTFVITYRKFVRKGIVFSADEFCRISEVDNLGVYRRSYKNNIAKGIDKVIDKKANDYSDETDEEIDKKIVISLKKKLSEMEKVFIIGNAGEENLEKLSELVSKNFDELKVESSNDAHDTLDNVEKIMDADAVIIVSKREKTNLPDLLNAIKLAKKYDKEILGNVIY